MSGGSPARVHIELGPNPARALALGAMCGLASSGVGLTLALVADSGVLALSLVSTVLFVCSFVVFVVGDIAGLWLAWGHQRLAFVTTRKGLVEVLLPGRTHGLAWADVESVELLADGVRIAGPGREMVVSRRVVEWPTLISCVLRETGGPVRAAGAPRTLSPVAERIGATWPEGHRAYDGFTFVRLPLLVTCVAAMLWCIALIMGPLAALPVVAALALIGRRRCALWWDMAARRLVWWVEATSLGMQVACLGGRRLVPWADVLAICPRGPGALIHARCGDIVVYLLGRDDLALLNAVATDLGQWPRTSALDEIAAWQENEVGSGPQDRSDVNGEGA